MNLVVLAVDRLHQGYLGPYGNAWVGTTAFNRLAAKGFTFDHAVSDMPELDAFYRACWAGGQELSSDRTLPKLLSAAGLPMTLLTDEPLLNTGWHGEAIERLDLTLPDNPQSADTAEETHLAEVFASSIAWLSEAREPFSLWIHTRGLGSPWDAPLEYRDRYSDEEEAPPPRFVDVPQLVLRDDYDPDELLGYCQAYAGQVRLLDECLAGLMEWLDEGPVGRDTLLVVVGARHCLGRTPPHWHVGQRAARRDDPSTVADAFSRPHGTSLPHAVARAAERSVRDIDRHLQD